MSWRRIRAVVVRHALVVARDPGYWFILLVLPVVDTVFFVSFADADDPNRVATIVGGLLVFHVVWQMTLAGAMGALEEVWSRNLLNVIVTPLRDVETLTALGIIGAARSVVSSGLVLGVAFAFFEPGQLGPPWVWGAALVVATAFAAALAIWVMGLVLQFGDRAEVFSWGSIVVLTPLCGVFYPVADLPAIVQPVARVVPLTGAFDALRAGVLGEPVDAGALTVSFVATTVALIAAMWFYAVQLRRFRRHGWITRFS